MNGTAVLSHGLLPGRQALQQPCRSVSARQAQAGHQQRKKNAHNQLKTLLFLLIDLSCGSITQIRILPSLFLTEGGREALRSVLF